MKRIQTRMVIAQCVILALSILIGVVSCEIGARLFLNPGDYLSVTPIRDEVLGIRVSPDAPGFDKWGFRNGNVPSSADIVAVGDSHTYGNNATTADSWPYVAGRSANLTAYNLGLGGYGPNQYYHLLRTYALQLKPRWIFCGLYFGDDFENAFLITYGKDHWSFLRNGKSASVDPDIWEKTGNPSAFQSFRNWLSRTSVVYQLVVHGPILGNLKGFLQITEAARDESQFATSLILPDKDIREAFRPVLVARNLDQSSPAVREGMRITFELLRLMHQASRESGAEFVVVLIPTKETVFADYVAANPLIPLAGTIKELIANENAARQEAIDFFDRQGILYVDTLPALRSKAANHLYTPSDRDMHPDKNGYGVIGEAVAQFIKNHSAGD